MILSLAFVIICKKKRIRIPLIINIALQFSVLILTGSRAGYYVLAGATVFAVFFAIVNHAKNFKIKTMVISITSAALSLGIFLSVGFTLKEGLAYLHKIMKQHKQEHITQSNKYQLKSIKLI